MIFSLSAGLAIWKGLTMAKAAAPFLSLAVRFSPVLQFIRLYWREFLIGGLVLVILLLTFFKNRTIDDLQLDILICGSNLILVEGVNFLNGEAIDQCVAINVANAQDLYDAQLNANLAEERALTAEAESNATVESIHEDVQQFRGKDMDCRKLGDPLPDDFDSWLRDAGEIRYAVPDS